MKYKPWQKALILFGFVCLGWIIYSILDTNNALLTLQDGKLIQQYIESTGVFGPVIVILFMMLAILVSPLPSAPIAIAAGAVYGHTWGTVYVLIGSLSGASAAFFITRYLGFEYVQKIAQNYLPKKFLDSQNALMGIVFVSRLMPFLSFDVISYAAGLSSLRFWRFVIATFFGIIPASFFLAHVGSEMATVEMNRIAIALLLLGALTGVSLVINALHKKKEKPE